MAAPIPPSEAPSIPAPFPLGAVALLEGLAVPLLLDAVVLEAGALLEVDDEPPLAGPTTPPKTAAGALTV
jgi:hypothetical protein